MKNVIQMILRIIDRIFSLIVFLFSFHPSLTGLFVIFLIVFLFLLHVNLAIIVFVGVILVSLTAYIFPDIFR